LNTGARLVTLKEIEDRTKKQGVKLEEEKPKVLNCKLRTQEIQMSYPGLVSNLGCKKIMV